MIGWIFDSPGRSPRVFRTCLAGLPVLAAAMPAASEGARRRRQLRRVCRSLAGQGVNRLLTEESFADWPVPARYGLRPVDTAPLLRALAPELALAALAGRHVSPERAILLLCGERADPPVYLAAEKLCARVRGFRLEFSEGGEALAAHLYREYGLAPVSPTAEPALTLRFSGSSEAGEQGLCLSQPETVPAPACRTNPRCAELPLAELLWECGRLTTEQCAAKWVDRPE